MSLDALKENVEALNDWLRAATDLEKENARLTTQLVEQLTAYNELRSKYDILKQEAIKRQTDAEELEQTKADNNAKMEKLSTTVHSTLGMLNSVFRKLREQEQRILEAEAREQTLQTRYDSLQEREDALAAENAGLKIKLEAVNNHEVRTLKDRNSSEYKVTSSADQRKAQLVVESLERLQRRFNRLADQKERAERKFFKSYLEWSGFKEWWRQFCSIPSVNDAIRTFNRSLRDSKARGALPGNALKSTDSVARRHDDDPPLSLEPSKLSTDAIVTTRAAPTGEKVLSSKDMLEAACEDLSRTYHQFATQYEAFGFDAPPFTTEQSKEATQIFDTDKTQETSAGTPTRPFRFNLTGIPLPQPTIYESPTRRIKTPVRHVSPDSPVAIKLEESPIKVPNAAPPHPSASTPLGEAPVAGPSHSSLGKRKAPIEESHSLQVKSGRKSYVPLVQQYMDGTKVVSSNSSKKRHTEALDRDSITPKQHGKPIKGRSTTGKAVTRYEVNPDRNNGVNFAYDEVVRNKEERKRMEATDCDQCREFYKAAGPLPPRLQAPLWKSPTSSQDPAAAPQRHCKHHSNKEESDDSGSESEDSGVRAHRQEVSRHRYIMPSGETPPGFWDLDFPDTQRVEKLRDEAEKMHRKRERFMEKEAGKKDGKYRLK